MKKDTTTRFMICHSPLLGLQWRFLGLEYQTNVSFTEVCVSDLQYR